jgi:hypothetical protein
MKSKNICRFLFCAALLCAPHGAFAQPVLPRPTPSSHTTDATTLTRLLNGPTKISLNYENADFSVVLKETGQRFGVPLALSTRTAPKGPLTINLTDQPLWTVWETLRANVEYSRTALSEPPRGALLITPVIESNSLSKMEAGVFQLRATSARLSRKSWSVVLSMFVDPKLDIVPSSTRLRVTEAVDENGRNLLTSDDRTSGMYTQMPLLWVSQVSQAKPENIGGRLARLRGVISTTVVLNRQLWEVPLADLPAERTVNRAGNEEALTVADIKPVSDDRFELQLARVQKLLINPRFWESAQIRRNELFNLALFSDVKVLDAQSRAFYLAKTNYDSSYDDAAISRIWTATFSRKPREGTSAAGTEPQGAPAKLIWSVPGDVLTVELPFEFNDLTFLQQ